MDSRNFTCVNFFPNKSRMKTSQAAVYAERRRRVTMNPSRSFGLLFLWRTVILVLSFQSSNAESNAAVRLLEDQNATASPTAAPNNTTTLAPTPLSNATSTNAPTMAPHDHSNSTQAPTPSSNSTNAPTGGNHTLAPVVTSTPTNAPHPSQSPVQPPPHHDDKKDGKHGFSIWRILAKTLAYLILLFLSILAFGAIMNHRYRIYYFLRGVWYTILSFECTQWLLAKIGVRHRVDPMNTVIFDDNEMSYGLLMQENEWTGSRSFIDQNVLIMWRAFLHQVDSLYAYFSSDRGRIRVKSFWYFQSGFVRYWVRRTFLLLCRWYILRNQTRRLNHGPILYC